MVYQIFNWEDTLTPTEIAETAEMDIKPDMYVNLFTWNPNDRRVGNDDNYDMKWDTMILKYLKHLNRCCKYFCVVPEISPAGRLHCHGWYVIDDPIKWFKSVLPKLKRNGKFKPNKMRITKGLVYYLKDIYITTHVLRRPIPLCHLTLYEWNKYLRDKYLPKNTVLQLKNENIEQYFNWKN